MQRMQQKQKDAVATLAVEGLVGFREIFFRFFFPAWKRKNLSKQDVAKTLVTNGVVTTYNSLEMEL